MAVGLMNGLLRVSHLFFFLFSVLCARSAFAIASAGLDNTVAREAIEKSILAVERERWRALTEADTNTLKSLLGRNYYHIDSGGRLRSKTEFLQAIERGDFVQMKFSSSNHEIEIEGPMAIIRGLCSIEQQSNSSSDKYILRYVRVWQLISGRWVNTMHQTTRIKGTPEIRELSML